MKKLFSILVLIIFLGSISFYANTTGTTLDNLQVGDTINYRVSKFVFPIGSFYPDDSNVNLNSINFNLSGSEVGFKILSKDPFDGKFNFDSFVTLYQGIQLPIPQKYLTDIYKLLGPSVRIPSGTSLIIGNSMIGSDLINLLNSTGNFDGIPLYIEVNRIPDYLTKLANFDTSNTQVTTSSLETTDTLSVQLNSSLNLNYQPFINFQVNLGINAGWFKTGLNAGLLSFFTIFMDVSIPATQTSTAKKAIIQIQLNFDNKVNTPLPIEIQNQVIQNMVLDNYQSNINYNGIFNNYITQSQSSQINDFNTFYTNSISQNILRYSFGSNNGLIYSTTLSYKDYTKNAFVSLNPLSFDGFSGTPFSQTNCNTQYLNTFGLFGSDFLNYFCYPAYIPIQYNALQLKPDELINFLPTIAPAITPDWTIRQTSLNSINVLFQILNNSLNVAPLFQDLINYGIQLNSLNENFELRQTNNFKYFYGKTSITASFDASNALLSNRPPGFTGSERASLSANGNGWESYTNTGLIAGYGLNTSISLNLVNFPYNNQPMNGTLSFNLIFKIRNSVITSLPDASNATLIPPVNSTTESTTSITTETNQNSSTNKVISSPGFEVFSILLVCPIYIQRKYNNK